MSPAASPITTKSSLVTFTILVAGKTIPGEYAVTSIRIKREINKIGTARIEIVDGSFTGLTDDFPAAESGLFNPGKEVTIKAGYESTESVVFEGIIIKQGIKLNGESTLLSIEVKEEAIKMTAVRNNMIFSESSDSDIMSKLIKNSALTASVETTTHKHKEIVQYYCSDWDFLLMRADMNGMIVLTDGKKVTVEKPKLSASPVLSIKNGESVHSINAEIDSRFQFSKISSTAWDMSTQKMVKSSAPTVTDQTAGLTAAALSKVLGATEYTLQTPSNFPVSLIEGWATGKMTRSKLSKITGSVKFVGSSAVLPGNMIELAGFNSNFNGNVYVTGVEHVLTEGDWLTTVFMGLPFKSYSEEMPDIMTPPTSGMLSGIQGLQTAIVKQIEEDKEGQYRVLVTYPVLGQDNVGVWARLSTFYATNKSGVFFFPEVGDEVIIGFINEDPHQPVILGSLYSSKMVPPLTPEKKNQFKSIVTKSLMKLTFDEDKKIITIETPAKNSIVMDDDQKAITITDANNNKVELTKDGMTFTCAKDFTVTAQGKIVLNASSDFENKATGAYKVQGMSVEAKADTQFTAKGNMVEVNGAGQTVVKGAIVMIN